MQTDPPVTWHFYLDNAKASQITETIRNSAMLGAQHTGLFTLNSVHTAADTCNLVAGLVNQLALGSPTSAAWCTQQAYMHQTWESDQSPYRLFLIPHDSSSCNTT
jgi:hypothetical protein